MTTQTKEVKHTPGPWSVGDAYPTTVYAQYVPMARTLNGDEFDWLPRCRFLDDDTAAANARLIAAAPELLARLEQVLPYLYKMQADGVETVKPVQMMIEQVEAAIAKATK